MGRSLKCTDDVEKRRRLTGCELVLAALALDQRVEHAKAAALPVRNSRRFMGPVVTRKSQWSIFEVQPSDLSKSASPTQHASEVQFPLVVVPVGKIARVAHPDHVPLHQN